MSRKIYIHMDAMGMIDRKTHWVNDDAEQKKIAKRERHKIDRQFNRIIDRVKFSNKKT